jgi:hypothetical protein
MFDQPDNLGHAVEYSGRRSLPASGNASTAATWLGTGIQGQIYGYGLNPVVSGFVQVIAKCIPCVHISSLVPAIALLSGCPSASILSAFPDLQISSLIGAIAILSLFANLNLSGIKPSLEIEECDCG